MQIRLMTITDYNQVYSLWLNTSGMGLNSLDDTKEGIERFLKRNPNTCFVAEDEGKLVGVILSGHDGRRGHLYHTAVSEAYREQGHRKCGLYITLLGNYKAEMFKYN